MSLIKIAKIATKQVCVVVWSVGVSRVSPSSNRHHRFGRSKRSMLFLFSLPEIITTSSTSTFPRNFPDFDRRLCPPPFRGSKGKHAHIHAQGIIYLSHLILSLTIEFFGKHLVISDFDFQVNTSHSSVSFFFVC